LGAKGGKALRKSEGARVTWVTAPGMDSYSILWSERILTGIQFYKLILIIGYEKHQDIPI
jgi:hypothetical protein